MLLSIFGNLIPHREDEFRNSLPPIRLYVRVNFSYFDSMGWLLMGLALPDLKRDLGWGWPRPLTIEFEHPKGLHRVIR